MSGIDLLTRPISSAAPLAMPLEQRYAALSRPYQLGSHPLLERQQARESNARSYPRRIPLALKRAQGIYVEDVEGRIFIDCLAGAGTLALGHNHPVVTHAIQQALRDELPLHTLDLTTSVKDQFVETLFGLLPPGFAREARIQFCGPSGSDAIEAAIKLTRIATGRQLLLGFDGGYHGMTQGALQLMGNLGPKAALGGSTSGVQFLPFPYALRSPFGLDAPATARASARYVEHVLSDPESGVPQPAAMIVEIVQGEGGVIAAPDEWVRDIRRATQQARVPLIVDEVQSGIGRTGRMFAFEHAGIEPDVLVLSKAIGGSLPLAVIVYRAELDVWSPGAHAGTFRGNQLAMAAGVATLRYIQDHALHEHAAAMGRRLREHLQALQARYSVIAEVRGRGLMLGVELVDPHASNRLGEPAPATQLAARVQRACLERGLIIELGGRHGCVLRLLPPLIIGEREVDQVAYILREALASALQ